MVLIPLLRVQHLHVFPYNIEGVALYTSCKIASRVYWLMSMLSQIIKFGNYRAMTGLFACMYNYMCVPMDMFIYMYICGYICVV